MLRLEDLKTGLALVGLEPSEIATIAAVVPIGDDSIQVFYRTPDGQTKERLLGRGDEENISIATSESPWSFDGDAESFKLAVEAKRIDLAFLFDPMMAVHTSNIEPLPHQITAVYESMLPRQPLRFVLADDPGAGKTIMAGLYIRELVMRADAQRIVIVAPGSLVEQWRDELWEKFGLEFQVFSKELELATPSGNPFDNHDRLIVRLDQMSRNEELRDKLCNASWDLAIFDEAHKCAAHYYGNKLEKTKRFTLAEKLGEATRHLLLMTATPHNGKEEDYQLFLSLLDSDRFYGKFRDGVHKVDASDVMRRMVKEEMVRPSEAPEDRAELGARPRATRTSSEDSDAERREGCQAHEGSAGHGGGVRPDAREGRVDRRQEGRFVDVASPGPLVVRAATRGSHVLELGQVVGRSDSRYVRRVRNAQDSGRSGERPKEPTLSRCARVRRDAAFCARRRADRIRLQPGAIATQEAPTGH